MRRAAGGRRALLSAGLALAGACAPAVVPDGAPRPAGGAGRVDAPPGSAPSGSLGQDQISVRTRVGAVQIEITPLDDWALDAAAPDARARLLRVRDAHGAEAGRRSGVRSPALFLVSFSSAGTSAGFRPEDLHLISRGLRERPLAILPVTPAWGSRRLEPRSSAVAVYAYDAIDVKRAFVVSYQGAEDGSWADKIVAIEAERSRLPGSPLRVGPGAETSRGRGAPSQTSRPSLSILR